MSMKPQKPKDDRNIINQQKRLIAAKDKDLFNLRQKVRELEQDLENVIYQFKDLTAKRTRPSTNCQWISRNQPGVNVK